MSFILVSNSNTEFAVSGLWQCGKRGAGSAGERLKGRTSTNHASKWSSLLPATWWNYEATAPTARPGQPTGKDIPLVKTSFSVLTIFESFYDYEVNMD